jgi:ssDNA-binding Zn-finger/Zn-ribbon topoisomerase 1
MPKYKSNAIPVPDVGEPCPRCGAPMQIYQHREISDRFARL